MPRANSKAQMLRDKIVEQLADDLKSSADPSALATGYLDRSQDYRTLVLMNEAPAHAKQALDAWRSMLPEADTAQLLMLLADAYLEAANQLGQ